MRCFLTNCVLSISLFLTIALLPQISFAQSATGSLCGEVQDAAGRRVPAATVTVEARGSGLSRAVKADDAASSGWTICCPDPTASGARRELRRCQLNSGYRIEVPAGALGDFFGPGTTVGVPFAAQVGVRVSF